MIYTYKRWVLVNDITSKVYLDDAEEPVLWVTQRQAEFYAENKRLKSRVAKEATITVEVK